MGGACDGVATPRVQRHPPARAGGHPRKAPGLGAARVSMGAGGGRGRRGWPHSYPASAAAQGEMLSPASR